MADSLDPATRRMADELILDELFDLRLYERLRRQATGPLAALLDDLVAVENKHYAFWQEFFNHDHAELNFGRRVKLALLAFLCRLFGRQAVHLVLEGIEIYGIRKYLSLWEKYRGQPLGEAVRDVLEDEFGHEDEIVSRLNTQAINPERIRGIFLGFNDGLVEILGAVTGFYAALRQPTLVLAASISVAAAGAFSMAAGAYAATSSEREIQRVQRGKKAFLERTNPPAAVGGSWSAGMIVGVSYFFGSALPVLPVFFGAQGPWPSIAAGAAAAVAVSAVLAFLSGMNVRRRILLNLAVISLAVAVTYTLGAALNRLWGINL